MQPPPQISTPQVLARIREVVNDMVTPSWLQSVPHKFGDKSSGTLKADEWRTMTTVYLPIALISLWGKGTIHGSSSDAIYLRAVLHHTMDLVCAVSIACLRTMTLDRMNAYLGYLKSWISGMKELHPSGKHTINGHMAFHIYDFLLLFGPARSWWCFPFERLIGHLQRLNHNHKHGQLEASMAMSFLQGARLRQWIDRPDCPELLKECKILYDRAFGDGVGESDSPADSAYMSTPAILRRFVKSHRVAFRARYSVNQIIYNRSSTHVGNSLVMFYPKGDKSQEPVPGCIEHIMFEPNGEVTFTIRRQLPALPGFVDPYIEWPHFPARVYSTSLSPQLEGVDPEWIVSQYARWAFDKDHAVVLNLSRVCAFTGLWCRNSKLHHAGINYFSLLCDILIS